MDEKLIAMVRERPALYNLKDKNYKDNAVKDNNWSEIGNEYGSGTPALDVKAKWKNLRDTFVRRRRGYKKKTASGAGTTAEPTWIWYKQMEWLEPYLSKQGKKRSIPTRETQDSNTQPPMSPIDSVDGESQSVGSQSPSANSTRFKEETTGTSASPESEIPPTVTKKRKLLKRQQTSDFEESLAKHLKVLQHTVGRYVKDECSRFGEEVADDISKITDPYQRALAMRSIRDSIFTHRFTPTQVPSYSAQSTTPKH